jgi:hypothetical protein
MSSGSTVSVHLVDSWSRDVCTLAIIGRAIGQFVAWIGAVLDTARLEDKTWFIVLLVTGRL